MPDIGEKATEREYKRLRAKVKDVYQQAYEEISKKTQDFMRRYEQKERQYRQMVADGLIDQKDFDAWKRGQIFQGKMWKAQQRQMQETLYHADQIALQMVNDSRFSVFAANANYIGYDLEKDARVFTSFGLYDADSVRRLIKDEPDLLPPRKLVGRDKSYQWYNRQIQTAITQGIIQGEPLRDIAKRIAQQTGETDMNAMLRNARTMQTGAQNAGRIEGMHQAQKLGIKLQKQWMATLDAHTRDAHADLDGQTADVDKPFKSQLGKIMYPGDPTANPANVWNCRCTLVSVYPEYPDEMMKRRDNETGEIIDNMTYKEWEEAKRQRARQPEPELTPAERIKAAIEAHEGDWTVDELQEIGQQMRDEIDKDYVDPQVRWHEINAELTDIWKEDEALKARNGELNRLIKATEDKALKKQYRQELADGRARRKELEARRKELMDEHWAVRDDDGRTKSLQGLLAKLRGMGGVNEGNLDEYADFMAYFDKATNARIRKNALEAMNCYPTAWLEGSRISANPWYALKPHWTTGRAYYNTGTGEIRFEDRRSTNVHELGHRFEQTVPGILQSEREFYARRTAGESLEWMGPGYDQSEKTRKDKFEHAYMGKDYGGDAYELVSMGFQYAFTDYGRLASDPDMQTWILGLLAAM